MSEREAFVIRTEAERTGDRIRLVLVVDLPAGVHIEPHQPTDPHTIPTVLDVEGLTRVTVAYPTPVIKELGWKDLTLTVLEGELTFVVVGSVAAGTTFITGTLSYQPCVGGACLPPRTVTWASPVEGSSAFSVLHALAA
jgi:DsbC/DsbD-like thiol-disulfide interchange protein